MKRVVATFLVSYDAEYLKDSVPLVYPYVDRIIFALDRERLTWNGNKFSLPDDFFSWVEHIDVDKKISIYEDTFYLPGNRPLVNDTRQRQMAAEYAGLKNTWHIQVDADEYVLNFPVILQHLRREEQMRSDCEGILYMGKWISLFKQDESGFYYVENGNDYELTPLAATNPQYIAARKTIFSEKSVMAVYIVHQTFARGYDWLKWKLNNWGHSKDFSIDSYLRMWQAVDHNNYQYLSNFHPNYPIAWKKLGYIQAENISEFTEKYLTHLKSHQVRRKSTNSNNRIIFAMLAKIIKKTITLLKKVENKLCRQ